MAQIEIDGVLFSPVAAHQLEPGDLYTVSAPGTQNPFGYPGGQTPTRHILALVERTAEEIIVRRSCPMSGSKIVGYPLNRPLLRAVGARVARGGAR